MVKETFPGRKDFEERQELYGLIAKRRSQHDCNDARCEQGPDGVDLFLPNGNPNPAGKPAKRDPPGLREAELRRKHPQR